jgi:hypothetical protein
VRRAQRSRDGAIDPRARDHVRVCTGGAGTSGPWSALAARPIDLSAGDVPAARREFDAELSSRAAAVYDDEFTMDACGLVAAHLAEGDASSCRVIRARTRARS